MYMNAFISHVIGLILASLSNERKPETLHRPDKMDFCLVINAFLVPLLCWLFEWNFADTAYRRRIDPKDFGSSRSKEEGARDSVGEAE
jgi:hypothetical protein